MSERWKLTVKGMTGHLIHVNIADPQVPGSCMSHLYRVTVCMQITHVNSQLSCMHAVGSPLPCHHSLQAASVLDVKKEVHRQDSKLPPHLQRLVYQAGASRTKLEDGCR